MEYINNYLKLSNAADEIIAQSGQAPARRVEGSSLVSRPREKGEEMRLDDLDPESVVTGYLASIKDTFSQDEEIENIKTYLEEEEDLVVEEKPTRPRARATEGEIVLGEAPDSISGEYPVSQRELENIIIREAKLRNIDPSVAVAIFRSEGAGAYQSQIARKGQGSLGGKEASFGPFQLYTGGGLGNQYEEETGRSLIEDNTLEGLTKQIQFSLDAAVESGWTPWYGRKTAGVSERQGLSEAITAENWRDTEE